MKRISLLNAALILLTVLLSTNAGLLQALGSLASPLETFRGLESVGTTGLEPHSPIVITANSEFTLANGVVGGNGAAGDPYIIQGWEISASSSTGGIRIETTSAHFVVRNVTVQSATAGSTGIFFNLVSNGRLENSTVSGNFNGIHFGSSTDMAVYNNTIVDNRFSINLSYSSNINFTKNNISNTIEGISIFSSRNIIVQGNTFESSGLLIQGTSVGDFNTHTITPDNLVNGNHVYYYKDCASQTLNDIVVGQLIVANCSQFEASNLKAANSTTGVEMAFVSDAAISGSEISGQSFYGIYLAYSSRVTVTDSNVSSNPGTGIRFDSSQAATVVNNHISSNSQGLFLYQSQTSLVYHNNFTDNTIQAVDSSGTANSWDNGYPSGGNYWSDYSGSDNCSSAAQDVCTGPDGLGDTPHSINPTTVDRYPLMQPFVPETIPPSWPQEASLTASNIGPTSLTLAWSTASDNVGVVQYRVYLEGTLFATVDGAVQAYDVSGLVTGTSYVFRVEAGDEAGNWSTDGPSVMVRTNSAPVLGPIVDRAVDEETTLSFTVTATDPDGDPLMFSLGSPPAGASITAAGSFAWVPSEADGPRSYSVTVVVSDGYVAELDMFTITVLETNRPPVLSPVSDMTVVRGNTLTFKANASDSDVPAETLFFSLVPDRFPVGATITPDGVFSWTPSASVSPGDYMVGIIVTDGQETDSVQLTVTLSETQQGPALPGWAVWAGLVIAGVSAVSVAVWLLRRKQ